MPLTLVLAFSAHLDQINFLPLNREEKKSDKENLTRK
jgi:hypothetical protein